MQCYKFLTKFKQRLEQIVTTIDYLTNLNIKKELEVNLNLKKNLHMIYKLKLFLNTQNLKRLIVKMVIN